MTTGFGVAYVFTRPEQELRTALGRAGIVLITAFLVLRGLELYGEPNAWTFLPGNWLGSVVDFLDVTKYPPSLQYLLMTLGPTSLLLAFADGWRGRLPARGSRPSRRSAGTGGSAISERSLR